MEIGFGDVALAQVEVFVYPVPVFAVEATPAERIDGGACHYGQVGHDKAWMVGRQVIVDGCG